MFVIRAEYASKRSFLLEKIEDGSETDRNKVNCGCNVDVYSYPDITPAEGRPMRAMAISFIHNGKPLYTGLRPMHRDTQ